MSGATGIQNYAYLEQSDSDNSNCRDREPDSANTSIRSDPTWRYSIFGSDRPGRGGMVFTGPDSLRMQRVTVQGEHRYVGNGKSQGPMGTSEANYIWRPHPRTPFHRPRSAKAGEIGWAADTRAALKSAHTRSGYQIQLATFRQELEDRHSHLLQNPW